MPCAVTQQQGHAQKDAQRIGVLLLQKAVQAGEAGTASVEAFDVQPAIGFLCLYSMLLWYPAVAKPGWGANADFWLAGKSGRWTKDNMANANRAFAAHHRR
eukprot:GHRR01036219.1.p3 GENE.GHRR01036219.1~~GHRR01036219.1.p3  ORF type:complete len:101 (+),score=24.83 GHRR01036219.1:706-1008(+)